MPQHLHPNLRSNPIRSLSNPPSSSKLQRAPSPHRPHQHPVTSLSLPPRQQARPQRPPPPPLLPPYLELLAHQPLQGAVQGVDHHLLRGEQEHQQSPNPSSLADDHRLPELKPRRQRWIGRRQKRRQERKRRRRRREGRVGLEGEEMAGPTEGEAEVVTWVKVRGSQLCPVGHSLRVR